MKKSTKKKNPYILKDSPEKFETGR